MTERTCSCGSNLPRRTLADARGIFCSYVCDSCETEKRSHYRPEIFTDPSYAADEQIEPDDDYVPEPDIDDSVEQFPLYPWEQ